MKRRKANHKSSKSTSIYFIMLMAVLIGCGAAVLLILLLSLLMYINVLDTSCIPFANTAIKIVGSFITAAYVIKKCSCKKILFGVLSGISYALFSFTVFSILTDCFALSLSLLSDICLSAVCGALCAIVSARKTAKAACTNKAV